jgi:nitrite reductase/ring-hydroxylating ferredoxin subunit
MGDYVKVASTADVPPGTGTVAEVAGQAVAVFNVNGAFYAIDNTCVHRGGPLGEGELDGDVVTCPWHAWQYDVKTGVSTTNPSARVKTYPVKVEGSDIKILI